MFQIKICGITSPADAQAVATAGADAIGLNFYAGSSRCVSPATAHEIVKALPRTTVKVGVFVNTLASQIKDLYDTLGLDLVQLHGDEPPEMLTELGGRPVVRAFRAGPDLTPIRSYLKRCRQLGSVPQMVLIDAYQAGTFGGTGRTADWAALASSSAVWGDLPLVLAGGLTAANVAAAIDVVGPAAVDTASGVETAPGRKSAQQVAAFVAAARAAFARRGQNSVSERR